MVSKTNANIVSYFYPYEVPSKVEHNTCEDMKSQVTYNQKT